MNTQNSNRWTGLAIALSVAIGVLVPASAHAEPVRGLYGSQSATYDGVFRQSLAIVALSAVGEKVPTNAVNWLVNQQCADGGYEAFRANSSVLCRPGDAQNYVGQDSNSAASAALALSTVKKKAEAQRALMWLRKIQNVDGGFPYYAGGTSDANSTALAIMAFRAAGTDPAKLAKGAKNPITFLASLTLSCSAPATSRGALAYMGGEAAAANDMATAQALTALSPVTFPTKASQKTSRPTLKCPGAVPVTAVPLANVVSGYLAGRLDSNKGLIPNAFGEGADIATTAWSVIGLAGSRTGKDASAKAITSLRGAAKTGLVDDKGQTLVGRAAIVMLAARAYGTNPRNFGGVNLVSALTSSLGK